MVAAADVAHFRRHGFVVLRRAFDPDPLARELDGALEESRRGSFSARVSGGVIGGRYVPMMCERTPVSLQLLDRFEPMAASLLGAPVLSARAKGVLYAASSPWHRDASDETSSVGFAAYLEPLRADSGALRVVAGSHVGEAPRAPEAGQPLETDPGDVIAFDEHLLHSSAGGRNRRQWRVDFVLDPVGREAEARVRDWFARQHPPDWDGGYDVDRYPSYGEHWLASGRRSIARHRALGVYEVVAREEAFARAAAQKGT